MEMVLISSIFLVLMVLGVPIGISLGVAAVVTIHYFDLGIEMLGVNFTAGIASFPCWRFHFSCWPA
jgi:C4-dicarboxylate transporter, DctM subunit